jgi:hypothetical protein
MASDSPTSVLADAALLALSNTNAAVLFRRAHRNQRCFGCMVDEVWTLCHRVASMFAIESEPAPGRASETRGVMSKFAGLMRGKQGLIVDYENHCSPFWAITTTVYTQSTALVPQHWRDGGRLVGIDRPVAPSLAPIAN